MELIMFCNQDKSYTISLHNLSNDTLFNVKIFEGFAGYVPSNLYSIAWEYSKNLAGFLGCRLVEKGK